MPDIESRSIQAAWAMRARAALLREKEQQTHRYHPALFLRTVWCPLAHLLWLLPPSPRVS